MKNNNILLDQSDIIRSLESARIEYEHMQREVMLSRITFPLKPSKDGIYRCYVDDSSTKSGRKQLSSTTLEGLKDKVYAHERSVKSSKAAIFKTVKDVFDITQSEKLKYVKSKEKQYSVQNTITRRQSDYNRFIANTEFEKKPIVDITKFDLEELLYQNLKRYDLKKKGLDNLKGILKPIFDMAFQEYWIDDNPYLRVDFKKFSNMLIENTPIEKRYHSNEEIEKMLSYIHQKQLKRPDLVTSYALEFQILTATRRGEIPPLRWEDISDYIDIHRELILLEKPDPETGAKSVIVEHTKTNKDRKFPVTKEIQELLDRLRTVHKKNGWCSPFLFPARNSNGCISAKSVYDFYRKMCKALDIEISKDFIKGPHSFRRSRVTEVINKSGGNLILASQLFGHSPQVAKQHYYTGLDMDEARKILES